MALTKHYVDGMHLLLHTIQELSHARDLPTVQILVREAARKITGCDGATFVLREGECCFYADEDAIAPLWKGSLFPLTSCISGWSMLNKKSVVIPDIYVDARIPHEAYRPTFVKSLVMVPIRTSAPIGAIGNYWAHEHTATPDEVQLLQALADSTSIAMENIQLYQDLETKVQQRTEALQDAYEKIQLLSYTDELTGLLNRRGFYSMGERALLQAQRAKQTCAVTFVDVDGLKRINDTLGHETGDAMIAHAGRILQQTCRQADVVARMGGDEFCVLSVGEDGGELLAGRLARAFLAPQAHSSDKYQLAVSMGTATTSKGEFSSLQDLVAVADRCMYENKRERREARRAGQTA